MDRKLAMGLAAVAAMGLLLYLRKSGSNAATAGTGGVLTSSAAALNAGMGNAGWASQPIQVTINQTKPAVADSSAKSPAPAPAPAQAAYNPWEMHAAEPAPKWTGDKWVQQNGQPVADGYAFGHLTPEQRAGRTDAEMLKGLI